MTSRGYIPGMRMRGIVAAVLVATALGMAPAGGPSPLFATEVDRRQPRVTGKAVGDAPPASTPLDMAIGLLLCAETRAAVERQELSLEILRWILSSAPPCPDGRLLFDLSDSDGTAPPVTADAQIALNRSTAHPRGIAAADWVLSKRRRPQCGRARVSTEASIPRSS